MRKLSLLLGFPSVKQCIPFLFVLTMAILFPGQCMASSQPYVPGHGVNFAIGNKYVVETDLVIQKPTALFDFQRMRARGQVLKFQFFLLPPAARLEFAKGKQGTETTAFPEKIANKELAGVVRRSGCFYRLGTTYIRA